MACPLELLPRLLSPILRSVHPQYAALWTAGQQSATTADQLMTLQLS